MAPRLTFVLGGARSGKSAYAQRIVAAFPPPWVYCATSEARDEEMRERIAHHRAQRGPGWTTLEAPLALAEVIARETRPMLVDCLTLWLSNIMLAGKDMELEVEGLIGAASSAQAPLVVVSNEVGLGIVPDNALARRFRDHAGRLNQVVARLAGRVVFMAAGLPMVLKDE